MRDESHRGVALHARSRGAITGVGVLFTIAAGAPLAAHALVDASAQPGIVVQVQVLAVAAGVSVVGAGLTGADPELETSTPRTGPRLRLAHLIIALLLTAGALTIGVAAGGWLGSGPSAPDLLMTPRNVAGFGGALALTATMLGARLSWVTPALWSIVLLTAEPSQHGWRLLASLPLQPSSVVAAASTAGGLLLAGATVYLWRGAPR